jgi:hypothetical protein
LRSMPRAGARATINGLWRGASRMKSRARTARVRVEQRHGLAGMTTGSARR